MNLIDRSYQIVLLFDVENGNPNGDPDAGNMPRVDPETNHGVITDVCLKRKIRNYVDILKDNVSPYKIYVRDKEVLQTTRKEILNGVEDGTKDAVKIMCDNFFDVRTFGAVMPIKKVGSSQVRGPVQVSFAKSIDPINISDITITRVTVETEKEKNENKERMMGIKYIIPYALYKAEIMASAHFAEKTGFSKEDFDLLIQSILHMFDHDQSAARPRMSVRKLCIFEHSSKLGNAPAHVLSNLIKVIKNNEIATSYNDYTIDIDNNNLPNDVSLSVIL